jgi:hypothetical protein
MGYNCKIVMKEKGFNEEALLIAQQEGRILLV